MVKNWIANATVAKIPEPTNAYIQIIFKEYVTEGAPKTILNMSKHVATIFSGRIAYRYSRIAPKLAKTNNTDESIMTKTPRYPRTLAIIFSKTLLSTNAVLADFLLKAIAMPSKITTNSKIMYFNILILSPIKYNSHLIRAQRSNMNPFTNYEFIN